MITVEELIRELEKMPSDLQVVMARDEEGNGFSGYIEVEEDEDNCVILWPGYFQEIDEAVDDYEAREE